MEKVKINRASFNNCKDKHTKNKDTKEKIKQDLETLKCFRRPLLEKPNVENWLIYCVFVFNMKLMAFMFYGVFLLFFYLAYDSMNIGNRIQLYERSFLPSDSRVFCWIVKACSAFLSALGGTVGQSRVQKPG